VVARWAVRQLRTGVPDHLSYGESLNGTQTQKFEIPADLTQYAMFTSPDWHHIAIATQRSERKPRRSLGHGEFDTGRRREVTNAFRDEVLRLVSKQQQVRYPEYSDNFERIYVFECAIECQRNFEPCAVSAAIRQSGKSVLVLL
jgi:hypothetical protein